MDHRPNARTSYKGNECLRRVAAGRPSPSGLVRLVPEVFAVARNQQRQADEDGHAETFGPGDAFVIPCGFNGLWSMKETYKNFFIAVMPEG
jgi:hypothetical protein